MSDSRSTRHSLLCIFNSMCRFFLVLFFFLNKGYLSFAFCILYFYFIINLFFGAIPGRTKAFCWINTQGLLLMLLRGTICVAGIEPRTLVCMLNIFIVFLALVYLTFNPNFLIAIWMLWLYCSFNSNE